MVPSSCISVPSSNGDEGGTNLYCLLLTLHLPVNMPRRLHAPDYQLNNVNAGFAPLRSDPLLSTAMGTASVTVQSGSLPIGNEFVCPLDDMF